MDLKAAKKLIDDANYLENRILVFQDKQKNKFCKIVWKGYTATKKDHNNEDGTVRVRLKDLLSGQEFSEDMAHIVEKFPQEQVTSKEACKQEILNIININQNEQKTLNWIKQSFENKEVVEEELEQLLTELWLESKVTKARFNAGATVVYNLKK